MVTAYKNRSNQIDINTVLNSGSDGNWIINVDNSIIHNNNLGSYIDFPEPLIVGDTYRLTYTVSSYTSCNVRGYIGDTAGTIQTSIGTFQQVLVHTGPLKVRFYATGTATIDYYKLEHLATTIVQTPIDPNNSTQFENKSWTLSYNPILQQWISYHSYLPNNYVIHPTGLLAKRNDTQVQLLNSGDYGKFFDSDIKPWIIESVFNDNKLSTKVFDNITVNLESNNSTKVSTNKFFDKLNLYNEFQSTGDIALDTTNITKKEKNWMVNKFTDLTNNTSNPLFSEDWDSIKTLFPIDKVINTSKIDNSKAWYLRARLRDKYLIVRFTENNIDNNKMTIKFILSIYRQSER